MVHFLVMAYRETERTTQRRAAVRARLLDAALGLVAEAGWEAASVVAVTERAGLATGTLYRHFDSKDALCAEVFRRAAGRELEQVLRATAASGTAADRLERGLRTFADRALRGRRLAHALLTEPAGETVESERLAYRAGYRAVFRDVLDEAVTAGEVPAHDTDVVAAAVTGAMGEVLVGPLAPLPDAHNPTAAQARVEALVALVRRCLPQHDRQHDRLDHS